MASTKSMQKELKCFFILLTPSESIEFWRTSNEFV